MYYIIKNNIDKRGCLISGEIVDHISTSIVSAKKKLEQVVISFVTDECGKKMSENIKIIDVHSLDQVAEPLVDCMLLYRVDTDPNQIHVYHRVTKQVSGFIYGQTIASDFTRVRMFELVEYNGFTVENKTELAINIEMVHYGPAHVKIPKPMTQAPICDMISALKSSPMYLKHKNNND